MLIPGGGDADCQSLRGGWVLGNALGLSHITILDSSVSSGEGLILKKEAGRFSTLLYTQKRFGYILSGIFSYTEAE